MNKKDRIREQQRQLMDTFTAMGKLNMNVIKAELSRSEFGTMKCISKCSNEQKTRVSDIVKLLGAPPPAVSRTLRNLENKGFIERTVDKEDRRNTFVVITEAGNKALDNTKELLEEFADCVFQNVGEDSLEKMNNLFKELLQAAEAELEKRKKEKLKGGNASE